MEKTTRNIGILLFNDVEVLDFAGPFEVFSVTGQREGDGFFKVFTIAEEDTLVSTVNGLLVKPHYTIDQTPPLDILIVPGGVGARAILKNERLLWWINQISSDLEILMSVCTGSLILAKAGLLTNLEATTHHECIELLKELSPGTKVSSEKRYIDNGKVLVAAGISAGIDLSLHLVKRLLGEEQAKETAHYMEYDYKL